MQEKAEARVKILMEYCFEVPMRYPNSYRWKMHKSRIQEPRLQEINLRVTSVE